MPMFAQYTPIKYSTNLVVLYFMSITSVVADARHTFIHIHQDCLPGIGTIVHRWWRNPVDYMYSKSTQLIITIVWVTESRFAPGQWETSLQSNAVSHWLGAKIESALSLSDITSLGITGIIDNFVVFGGCFHPSIEYILCLQRQSIHKGHNALFTSAFKHEETPVWRRDSKATCVIKITDRILRFPLAHPIELIEMAGWEKSTGN